MSRLFTFSIAAVVSIAAMTAAPASAVTYDKLAYLSFNVPVQVPGATLDAGTYRFHLTNPDTSRNVLQVMSGDGKIVYAMFHTIADGRSVLTDDPAVSFRETPAGVPPAVKSLFYGGEYHGYEFVYPKGGPIVTVEVPAQPAITYTPIPAAIEPVEPEAEPVAARVGEPVVEPPVEAFVEPEPAELPRTASALPLLAAGGLGSLLAGLAVSLLRRRT
jgi:hypothetical protein